jgi:hypothetical protein
VLSQELLGEYPSDPDEDEGRGLGGAFRPIGPGEEPRRAALEAETKRWCALPAVGAWPAPDVRFYEAATAEDIDGKLRELASLRVGWDDLLGYCAHAIQQSRMHRLLGFASFRQYCEFHHLRCIHGGYRRVVGTAPDALTWFLCGEPWTGPLAGDIAGRTAG